jgi:hypothetical protein
MILVIALILNSMTIGNEAHKTQKSLKINEGI